MLKLNRTNVKIRDLSWMMVATKLESGQYVIKWLLSPRPRTNECLQLTVPQARYMADEIHRLCDSLVEAEHNAQKTK